MEIQHTKIHGMQQLQGFFGGRGCTCSMHKFPGHGLNPSHSGDPSHSSDNTGSLTTRPQGTPEIVVLRNKFIEILTSRNKNKNSQVKCVSLYLKKPEKEEKTKAK